MKADKILIRAVIEWRVNLDAIAGQLAKQICHGIGKTWSFETN
jgi:hypothetical protein